MHSVPLKIPWLPLQNNSAKLRKPKSQNRSQGISLGLQTALFQGKDLLGGCYFKILVPICLPQKFSHFNPLNSFLLNLNLIILIKNYLKQQKLQIRIFL